MAIRKNKWGSYIVYWRDKTTKKQREKSFGPGVQGLTDAEEFEKTLGLIRNGPQKHIVAGKTLDDIFKYYFKNHQLANDNCKRHFVIRSYNIIKALGDVPVAGLKYSHIEKYIRERQKTVKNSTINRELNDLNAVLNFALKRNPPLIAFNPISGYPKLPNDDERIIPPTDEELAAIYAAASPHIKRFIVLCSYVIARPGVVEILSMQWRQVSWGALVIHVMGAAKNKEKSVSRRQAPIQPDLMKHLKKWHTDDKELFGQRVNQKPIIHYKGEQIRSIKKAWRATLFRAGIDRRIRPYDLRHRTITEIINKGGDIKTLSKIAGSSTATLMKHYQHVSSAKERETVGLVSLKIIKE